MQSLIVQPDGRILGMGFGSSTLPAGSAPAGAVARVLADGSYDPSFSCPFLSNQVTGLALQPDGKVIAVGSFRFDAPAERRGVVRLNNDGRLDSTFTTLGTNPVGPVDVALLPNGDVIVGGHFGKWEDSAAEGVVKLHTDGSRDPAFESNGTGVPARVDALVRQPDGKLLVGLFPHETPGNLGADLKLNGVTCGGVGRLAADGSLDTSFASPFEPNTAVIHVALAGEGKVLVGGALRRAGSADVLDLARLDESGALDPTFTPPQDGARLGAFAVQPDGKVLVSRTASRQGSLVRLNLDGSRDDSFSADFGENAGVDRLLLQPDGRIIIAGTFVGVGDRDTRLGRLNPDGSIDPTFDAGEGPDDRVRAMVLQPDGRVVIGGWFLNVDGTPRPCLARLLPNGTLDSSFVPVNLDTDRHGSPRHVGALALSANGRIVVGNEGASDSLLPANRVFRLEPGGEVDSSFSLGSGLEGTDVNALLVQPNDDIVVGGLFDVMNGVPRLGLARLVGSEDAGTSGDSGAGGGSGARAGESGGSGARAGESGGSNAGRTGTAHGGVSSDAAPPEAREGGGCGCRLGDHRASQRSAWFIAALALLAHRRRLRRRGEVSTIDPRSRW
jgi:uncharacterized delta-60 repeat protein